MSHMNWKSHRGIFLIIFIVIILAYGIFVGLSSTGKAYTFSGRVIALNIYDFLTIARDHPDKITLVIGTDSEDYEVTYGKEIADYLGVKMRYEDEVKIKYDLILIGSPETNGLISELLTKPYSKDESMVTLSKKNNLFLIASSKQQASKIKDIIISFDNEQELLSPDTVTFGFGGIMVYLIVLFFILISISIFFIERHRHSFSRHEGGNVENRLEILKQYVKKYEKQGYSPEKIKEGLISEGYNSDLVKNVMGGNDNAGADISN